MHMPYLSSQSSSGDMISTFTGYDHNPVINDGEWYDMKNLTSDKYPLAGNRDKRGALTIGWEEYISGAEIIDICGKDKVYIIFKYNGQLCIADYNPETQMYDHTSPICNYIEGDHQVIQMGAYIIVFPEKYQVNTLKTKRDEFTEIEPLEETLTTDNAMFRLTNLDGEALIIYWVQDQEPEQTASNTSTTTSTSSTTSTTSTKDVTVKRQLMTFSFTLDGSTTKHEVAPTSKYVWIDTSTETPTCKRWSEQQQAWATLQPYLEVSCSTQPFEKADAIECTFPDEVSAAIKPADEQKYWVIAKAEENSYFRIPVTIKGKFTSGVYAGFTAKRSLPDLDYIIESQNRLWGCRYGTDSDGETINEIFASKLADAKNWHYFANTSVDSYYVSLGSDGPFTGAVAYQSTPVFFKNNCIHRISGSYPAQYYLTTIQCYGVKEGCSKSAIVMNDVVYYMSPVGMLAYGGSLPTSLAEAFGSEKYSNAISGTVGNRLYVSMQDESGNWSLFVFDDSRLTWFKEDNLHVRSFTTYGHECLCVNDSTNTLISLTGVYGDLEDDIEWSMTTGEIGYTTPMRKRLLKLVLRLKLEINARAKIEIQYDGDGVWRYVNDLRPTGLTGGYSVPVIPTRCDHFSVRISGKGNISILSMTKFYVEGSDKD